MPLSSRMVMEEVPGQEIALCHIISSPHSALVSMLGLEYAPVALLSVTPSEAVYIAADLVTKAAHVKLVFVDRYLGTILVTGTTSALETALVHTMAFLATAVGIAPVPITRS